ncbi:PhnD/SsuA/transferrin family substrate-binding protein [Epibacterium sp. SM1969]|uniref:PhnD/SsuA/transferrin family substrate-binding protein n=1 Tax=Tritonibacter aquimaris TaxID=2663379 RepID=A0A844AS31_9RHOB|nr:PhnD/SsuA/transferrin family substrate-binding protein [Tritonibacter aquimaris]MQY43883.1 PhnD/SsuA/transferrin family substrate-binding protein [Tritonibacter aquimaris]
MKRLNVFHRQRAKIFSLFIAVGILFSGAASAEINLKFGTYAADKPTETVKKYRPFLMFLESRMSEELGQDVNIEMIIAKEYETSIRQLAEGEVDFARFGPASYVLATDKNPDVQIVAMESKNGQKRFKGIIAVHRDNPIQSLEELAGLTFAFGDELSTIGRYLSQSALLEVGITGEDLHSFKFLGRHDTVGLAVGAGKFTAGALKESTFKKLVAQGVPIRALASFDNVTKPWISASDLPKEVYDAMQRVMLSSENEEIVRRVSKNGFLIGSDADYQPIRQAMQDSVDF